MINTLGQFHGLGLFICRKRMTGIILLTKLYNTFFSFLADGASLKKRRDLFLKKGIDLFSESTL